MEEKEMKQDMTQMQEDPVKAAEQGHANDSHADDHKSDKRKHKKEDSLRKALQEKEEEYKTLYEKHLRLLSEFDNYRKRTVRERADLLKTAGEEVIQALLPVLDDFERALKSTQQSTDPQAIKDGIILIQNKLSNALSQKGLEPMNTIGQDFDTDFHEAITDIPAPSEEMKGKVIDETQKGYMLGGKVIRFAKVVVGK
ncbi:MAG: nucleotide exchange factor GrpE [Lentimicrobiaceae bacterium]|nr:nucleotide exchange factor GrpE [Lentimicrobiaceae bacterium]